MAVYKRNYHTYDGPLTQERFRFLVMQRYAFEQVFASRLFLAYFIGCFAAPAVAAILIYLHQNATALLAMQVRVDDLIKIDGTFFLRFLSIQGTLAFVLTSFVGPGLVAPDLANNALPLYLSRPLNRTEYVLGKMAVLIILLSLVTWVPLLLLFAFQTGLVGQSWMFDNFRILMGILVGSGIWILIISLLSLALSAWVKWKPVAGALLFGVFFAGAGFAEAINSILYTSWGTVINMTELIRIVWTWLFLGVSANPAVSIWSAFVALLAICAVCVWLLSRKIRAYEVVR